MSDPIRRLTVALGKRLDLSSETVERAADVAERAYLEHPINRSDRVVAAGAIYFVALLCNEKRAQAEVAYVTGVSTVAIREAYQDIWKHEAPETYQCSQHTHKSEPDRTNGSINRLYRHVKAVLPVAVSLVSAMALALLLGSFLQFRHGIQFDDPETQQAFATAGELAVIYLTTVALVLALLLLIIKWGPAMARRSR